MLLDTQQFQNPVLSVKHSATGGRYKWACKAARLWTGRIWKVKRPISQGHGPSSDTPPPAVHKRYERPTLVSSSPTRLSWARRPQPMEREPGGLKEPGDTVHAESMW